MAGADGLVSNEWATYNPGASGAAVSSDWVVNSGSLFRRGGAGWTGVPDDATPDTRSASGTNSAVFRLYTRRSDFGDVRVQLDLRSNALTTTASTPAVAWDGVHIFLRYQSQYQLYYASVNRRDGHLVVKKKCQGGTENGGTYYELGAGEVSGHPIPFGSWQRVGATVRNLADGSVAITLQREGTTLLTVTDTGVGCAPIRAAGAVGLRGDNDDFEFTNVTVSAF